jgi:transcriptional regulator with XRE-family HTH domain
MREKSNIIHIPRETAATGAMSIAQYQAERQKLRDTYGDSRDAAGDRWEQELAKLFARSGWTQEQLAEQEGKTQAYISYLLCFGGFLLFLEHYNHLVINSTDLTERRFRSYWRLTAKGDSKARFREVIRLMEEPTSETTTTGKPKSIGERLMDQFADGQWRSIEDIQAAVAEPMKKVKTTLEGMIQRGSFNSECSRKPVGKTQHYRIIHQTRRVSIDELRTKLSPIVRGLIAEGKKNMATMSPGTVAHLANQLKTLLDEWTK